MGVFCERGQGLQQARLIDTKLVEPLFELRDLEGNVEPGDMAHLAVRNLLRGYLLRIPTGQAVVKALNRRLGDIREIEKLTRDEIRDSAASQEQRQALEDGGFLERTPLWYYILAEAAVHAEGQRLGPVGSTIVAEVLVGLIRHSQNSILRRRNWAPTLPSGEPGPFTLTDLLKIGGVLKTPVC